MVSSNRTRSSNHKPKHKMFHLNMRKNFSLKVAEPWKRLPREVIQYPSLEAFKTHLEAIKERYCSHSSFVLHMN